MHPGAKDIHDDESVVEESAVLESRLEVWTRTASQHHSVVYAVPETKGKWKALGENCARWTREVKGISQQLGPRVAPEKDNERADEGTQRRPLQHEDDKGDDANTSYSNSGFCRPDKQWNEEVVGEKGSVAIKTGQARVSLSDDEPSTMACTSYRDRAPTQEVTLSTVVERQYWKAEGG